MAELERSADGDSSGVLAAVYFGCWDRVGHGFHLPNGRTARDEKGRLDVTPWGWKVENLTPTSNLGQGAAALHHKDGWTALAIHDYTVDSRGNSKSVFCFHGTLTFEEALYEAGRTFSEIIARVGDVRLVES